MRLSTILSEYENNSIRQVESIIDHIQYYDPEDIIVDEERQPVYNGSIVDIDIGTIVLHFFCSIRNDTVTYRAKSHKIHCLVINSKLISIDCTLDCIESNACEACDKSIQAWFLVEADYIFSDKPNVRILKYNFKLPNNIKFLYETSDRYSEWFAKADYAYKERLGAGAVIYLRAIFENLIKELGINENAKIYSEKGKLKPFEQVLAIVDEKCEIIPELYRKNGYTLFRKLSEIAHGNASEQDALDNYLELRRLVVGIVDNINKKKEEIKNNREIKQALQKIGLINEENKEQTRCINTATLS